MQDAGRILLMPKGDYSADATYEMLDIVNHNDASWVCKKDCTGQEPSDSNTEYWQRFGLAVDMSNLDAKTLDGHKAGYFASKEELCALPMQHARLEKIGWYRIATMRTVSNAYGCIVSFGNAYGSGGGTSFVLAFNGSHGKNVITQLSGASSGGMVVDKVRCVSDGDYKTHIEIHYNRDLANGVRVHVGNVWVRDGADSVPFTEGEVPEGYTVTEFELVSDYTPIHKENYSDYALPNTGGKISKAGYEPLLIENTQAGAGAAYIRFLIAGISKGQLGVSSEGNPVFYSIIDSKSFSLLHTGNKPNGTYTGNGDATERTVNIGGIGSVVDIWSENGNAIVMPTGGFYCNTAGEVKRLTSKEAKFANGVLTLATTNVVINANGTKTEYQVH